MSPHRYLCPIKKSAAGGGWAPPDEPDIGFLVDGSDLSTITKDGSNLVSNLNNVNGYYGAFTAAGSARPTWTSAVQNGLGGIYFEGTNNLLTGPDTRISAAVGTAMWGFLIFKAESKGSGQFNTMFSIPVNAANEGPNFYRKFSFLLAEGVADYQTAWTVISGTSGSGGSGLATGVRNNGVAYSDGNAHIYLWSYTGGNEQTSGAWTHIRDGSTISLSASGTGQSGSKTAYLGGWADGSLRGKYYLLEMGIFTGSALDSTKQANVEGYALNKWNIP